MDERLVSTPVGTARLDWFPPQGRQRATVVLGHGNATGVEAMDLQALARALPPLGITVVLVTQPYRVDGNPKVADEQSLDRAWTAIWPSVSGLAVPLVAGGRSAGSQVACRTARALGADAVLALAYPLLGPGSPAELLGTGRPTLVVQGGRDPFGRPDQFPKLPPDFELVEIPSANHMFATGRPSGGPEPLAQVTEAVIDWLDRRLRGAVPIR
ncbi:MAG TPA: alpha/beta family hydrolase [Actinomycetota bacterium]|jgi:predicted alpha/beta-hydrolase family hydrolase